MGISRSWVGQAARTKAASKAVLIYPSGPLKQLSYFPLTTKEYAHLAWHIVSADILIYAFLSFQDHWIQPFKLSLHPFAMLTAPEAAEYAWKQSEHISPQIPQGWGRVTWGSSTGPSRATKLQPAELQQLHIERIV